MERVKTPSRPRTGCQSQMEIQWPRIRLYLVGGCHPRGKVETWLLAAPDGSAVSAVERAQFFGFNKVGLGAARKAGRALVQGLLAQSSQPASRRGREGRSGGSGSRNGSAGRDVEGLPACLSRRSARPHERSDPELEVPIERPRSCRAGEARGRAGESRTSEAAVGRAGRRSTARRGAAGLDPLRRAWRLYPLTRRSKASILP